MSDDNTKHDPLVDESTGLATRRKILRTGAALIPTIVTMHALPPSAGTDYTRTAYLYGVNKGLCRNPEFSRWARTGSRSEEFVPCGTQHHDDDDWRRHHDDDDNWRRR